jgi:hypothetical protein
MKIIYILILTRYDDSVQHQYLKRKEKKHETQY